ncbi:hypothetical protein BDV11DRAFT_131882 [Aspergillus similis]
MPEWKKEVQQGLRLACKLATQGSSLHWLLLAVKVPFFPRSPMRIFIRQYHGGFQRKIAAKDMLGRPSQKIWALLHSLRAEKPAVNFRTRCNNIFTFFSKEDQVAHSKVEWCCFLCSTSHKHHCHAPASCPCFRSGLPAEICEGIREGL